MPQKKPKRKSKPQINYPTLTLKKWIPPYLRPKKKRVPAYIKPPGINQPIPVSTLVKVWRSFLYVEEGDYYVLHGDFSERNFRYGPRKGFQGMGLCLAAIAYSKTVKMSKWNRGIVNDMMDLGNRIYRECIEKAKTDDKSEMNTIFYLGDAMITMSTIRGEERDFDDIESALNQLLSAGYEGGIVSSGVRYMALWSSNGYYLFDPGDHGKKGEVWNDVPGCGYSVVIKSNDISVLAKLASDYFPQKRDNIVITPCTLFSVVKYDKKSPETLIQFMEDIRKASIEPTEERIVPEKPKIVKKEIVYVEPPDFNNLPDEEVMPENIENSTKVPESKRPLEYHIFDTVSYYTKVKKIEIIRASTHQSDRNFTNFEGRQQLANAIAALTMLRLQKSRNWIPKFLDEILQLGNQIFTASNQSGKISDTCKKITLKNRDFTPDIVEYHVLGRLQSKVDGVIDLIDALITFFADNDTCVITKPISLAIWHEDQSFYMFNPNGCDDQGVIIDQEGVACVTKFQKIDDLVELFNENLAPRLRNEQFVISRVIINDYVQLPEDWNNFKAFHPKKWILRGDFSIKDRRFDKDLRNNQFTSIAIMAITYHCYHPIDEWNNHDLNQILQDGTDLHIKSIEHLKEKGKFTSNRLSIDEIDKKFDFEGDQVMIEIQEVLDCSLDVNLGQMIKEFFRLKNTLGLITIRGKVIGFFRFQDGFFYINPFDSNENGLITSYGTSCIVRLLNLEDLIILIETNLNPGNDDQRFTISKMNVTKFQSGKRPIDNYVQIDDQSGILRSSYHTRSDRFKSNAGKQNIAMIFLSLGMHQVYAPLSYDIDIIDQILIEGDRLYVDSLIGLNDDQDEVTIDNCSKRYRIGFNSFLITYQQALTGNFEEDFEKLLGEYLEANMINDFTDNQLVITCDYFTVSIWKKDGLFFLFDPERRDEIGQIIGKDDWSLKRRKKIKKEESIEENLEEEEEENPPEEQENQEHQETQEGLEEDTEIEEEEIVEEIEEEEEEEYEPKEKHTDSYWEIFLENGRACILWFLSSEKLIRFLMENTPPNQREDLTFLIYPIQAKNVIESKKRLLEKKDQYSGDWYDWKEIDYGFWILRGTMDQSDELFPAKNRDNQSISNCLAALSYTKLYALKEYKTNTVDTILRYGDKIYSATSRIIDKNPLGLSEMIKKFQIDSYRLEIDVNQNHLQGNLIDLSKVLENFFSDSNFGLIESKALSMAIWKGASTYYMFDPGKRGPNGRKNPNGVACITRYLKLQKLCEVFVANLPQDGKNDFTIHQCELQSKYSMKIAEIDTEFNGFELIDNRLMIIGTRQFDNDSQGATCIVAITMSMIHKTDTWTKLIVDEIVSIGNRLYECSMINMNNCSEKLNVHLINRKFNIGKLNIDYRLKTDQYFGKIDIKKPGILSLRTALKKFFEKHQFGIIETDTLSVGIWREFDPDHVFIFRKFHLNGSLIKMKSIKEATEYLIGNFNKLEHFSITALEIIVGKTDKKVEIDKSDNYKSINDKVSILSGSKSQSSPRYSKHSRGNQDLPNCFVAFVINRLIPINLWSYQQIDTILDIGDQLYKDSYITYMPRNPKLGLQNVIREILIGDIVISLNVYKPVIRKSLNIVNLEWGLRKVFDKEKSCLITVNHQWLIAIKIPNFFYLFDPYDNDDRGNRRMIDGNACVLRYRSINRLIKKLISNFDSGAKTIFTLVLIDIDNIKTVN